MKPSWGMRRPVVGVAIAAIASIVLTQASGVRSALMADRQVAARALLQSNPDFTEPVVPGDTIADHELGQPDFFHNSSNFVDPQSLSLNTGLLNGVAVDQSSIPNRVYVADALNNRVLGWASVSALTNDKPADIVIGQPDFFSNLANNGGISAASLNSPAGVAVDSSGNLYVADSGNNRVLEYNSPFAADGTPGSGDRIADEVFGQSNNFTSVSCNLSSPTPDAQTLCNPLGVGIDLMGVLYIADSGNNRVLGYIFPSINTSANFVFGQPNLLSNTANNGGISSTSLSFPEGVASDAAGNLYVADRSNSRVLEYNTPVQNHTANRVFGQSSFNLGSCDASGINANALCLPAGVALDLSGRLYVGDQQNNRVLVYNTPLTSQTANRVYGQSSLTVNSCNNGNFLMPTASTLCFPGGVALDTLGDLFVADANNNRVLKYAVSQVVAGVVLGQPDFTHRSPNAVDASALWVPNAVAMDNSIPRLYVADTNNNRVLGYNSPAAFLNGGPANIVIGQPDFFSNSANQGGAVSAKGLSGPAAVAVDKAGNLYVADTNNNRVLRFAAPVTTNEAANLVIGQTSFTNNFCNNPSVGGATLCGPAGVGIDGSLNLYVADSSNNRVLEYNAPLANGASAHAVLGQAAATTNDANHGGISATSLWDPIGIAVNAGAGFLYVADRFNNRVLEYKLPLATGQAADKEFGQGLSFSTNTCNGTGSGAMNLCLPEGVAPTGAGDLYIADTNNNRILEYTHPLVNGQAANLVFGQGGLFSSGQPNLGGGPSPEGLNRPLSVAVDSAGNLYCADNFNNRALVYLAPLAKPAPTPTPLPATVSPTSLAFGSVPKGTFSSLKAVKLTNTAGSAITVNSVAILGTYRTNFAQNNGCIGSLGGGASCTINVLFMPTAPGGTPETATLTIYDTASNSPQTVPLSGTSLEPVLVSPSSLAFGSVTVGVTSAAMPVTVKNQLSTSVSIKVAIGGANPGDFAQTNTCGSSLAALASCTVSVTFKPTITGARSATLTVTDSPDVDSPHNVSLSGTGM